MEFYLDSTRRIRGKAACGLRGELFIKYDIIWSLLLNRLILRKKTGRINQPNMCFDSEIKRCISSVYYLFFNCQIACPDISGELANNHSPVCEIISHGSFHIIDRLFLIHSKVNNFRLRLIE